MAVKVIVLILALGAPVALFTWAVVRIRQAYVRFHAELPRLGKDAAPVETPVRRDTSVMADTDTETGGEVASGLDEWDTVGLSAPLKVSVSDREYYRRCWEHILGTFSHWPIVGLDLAKTLTVNLMLNRGLVVPDSESDRLGKLPPEWGFPTAEGYREAQSILEQARDAELPSTELSKALMLFRALFEEILTAPTSEDALR